MQYRTTILRTKLLLSGTALISGIVFLPSNPATAACTFVPTPGNDTFVCNSGISAGGLTDLDGTLTLGDSGTKTGALTVDSSSAIFGGDANGVVSAFATDQLAQVVNAGRIDLTNGSGAATDTFTIRGNYVGQGGEVRLNTVLGDDSSAADKLVIDGGTATGTTGISVTNAGGIGGQTLVNGIMVVQGINGGTTAGSAFSLSGPAAAGAYEYLPTVTWVVLLSVSRAPRSAI